MGYLAAADMAAQTDLESALSWHLRSNHFPPVPQTMVAPGVAAIAACESDVDRMVDLPAGVTWRGQDAAPAWALVEALHLHAFLSDEEI